MHCHCCCWHHCHHCHTPTWYWRPMPVCQPVVVHIPSTPVDIRPQLKIQHPPRVSAGTAAIQKLGG